MIIMNPVSIKNSELGLTLSFLPAKDRRNLAKVSKTMHGRLSFLSTPPPRPSICWRSRWSKGLRRMQQLSSSINCRTPILSGQGDYVYYYKNNGVTSSPSEQDFRTIHALYLRCKEAFFSQPDLRRSSKMKLTHSLQARLTQLNPDLHCHFLPSILFQLCTVYFGMEEDFERGSLCSPNENPHQTCSHPPKLSFQETESSPRFISFLCLINAKIVDQLQKKHSFSLNFESRQEMCNYYIRALKRHLYQCKPKPRGVEYGYSCTAFFLRPSTLSRKEALYPVGINTKMAEDIFRNTLVLECHGLANTHLIIYRGARLERDSIVGREGGCYSLSYSSGLLSGLAYDADACAYTYGVQSRQEERGIIPSTTLYALPVPLSEFHSGLFDIPVAHSLYGLCRSGEFFHARTRSWYNDPLSGRGEENQGFKDKVFSKKTTKSNRFRCLEFFNVNRVSLLSKESATDTFNAYLQNKAIVLNGSDIYRSRCEAITSWVRDFALSVYRTGKFKMTKLFAKQGELLRK